jgi:hypothetical protein
MAQKSGLIRHLYGPQGLELVVGKLDTLGQAVVQVIRE